MFKGDPRPTAQGGRPALEGEPGGGALDSYCERADSDARSGASVEGEPTNMSSGKRR